MTTSSLLQQVAWDSVNERVRHEQRNREVYVPPISLFRWWARRPHALIGALIDAAANQSSSPVVSDPFSGGGTVAMEAARRGFSLYAQDLHPWAITGLATVLDGVDTDELRAACDAVLRGVDEECAHLYETTCPLHGTDSTLAHVFWVRSKSCPTCSRVTYLYPYSLITRASRRKDESAVFLGCPSCGRASEHDAIAASPRCPGCRRTIPATSASLLLNRRVTCRDGKCGTDFPAFDGTTPTWAAVLVQRSCSTTAGLVAHFDVPTVGERDVALAAPAPAPVMEEIAAGLETSVLRRAGFRRWADVFPPRQLRTLVACSTTIANMDTTDAIRRRLRLAVCGAAEMAGYLSRWDRHYPKAFEAMANHRFPALGLACETNLLGRRGRGTLRRRFDHTVAAARWAQDQLVLEGTVRAEDNTKRRRRVRSGALVVCGSSERQLPSDGSVDLVLTDPPYFDDVQYAELAGLFLVWARATDLLPDSVALDVASEAVANSTRGTGVDEYRELLTRIFTEACRTLRPTGRVILTYHNTDIRAWWGLARALHDAKLEVCAVAVAETENAADHSKRGSNAFTSDLVIECRRAGHRRCEVVEVGEATTGQARELRAAGLALARAATPDLHHFIDTYRRERGSIAKPRIRVPEPEET